MMEPRKVKNLTFAVSLMLLVIWSLWHAPVGHGDSNEYYGMSASFDNHFTPELTQPDIDERAAVLAPIGYNPSIDYAGYYRDLSGKWYSYHFWFYSLLNMPAYWILDAFGSPANSFQLTNVLLLALGVWWILYRTTLEDRQKIWLTIGLLCSPVWLYLPWQHPEVFTFVFVLIGLLELSQKRKYAAILFTAAASFQNPGVAIITAYIVLTELFEKRKLRFFTLGATSSIVLFPYLWFWFHYHKFSIISEVSTGGPSLAKAASLFLDLNFGLILYTPVLLILAIVLLVKRRKETWIWSIVLCIIALVCSVQSNWNSGMAYINRYAIWFIPILLFALLTVATWSKKKFYSIMAIYAATTGIVTITCMLEYEDGNYLMFGPVAKAVIAKAPALYNPVAEVFVERGLQREVIVENELPVSVSNENGVRKVLSKDGTSGKLHYVNSPIKLGSGNSIYAPREFKPGEDVFKEGVNADLITGWYPLEKWDNRNTRWINDKASLAISTNSAQSKISMFIGSFYEPRNMRIYVNDKLSCEKLISPEGSKIEFSAETTPVTYMRIETIEPSKAPADIPEMKNTDGRKLALYVSDLEIR